MIRLSQAIVAVMSWTLAVGAAGGIVGATVGRWRRASSAGFMHQEAPRRRSIQPSSASDSAS